MDRNEPVPVFKTVPVVKERKVPNGKKRTAIKKTGWETAWGRPPARSRQTHPQIHMGQRRGVPEGDGILVPEPAE